MLLGAADGERHQVGVDRVEVRGEVGLEAHPAVLCDNEAGRCSTEVFGEQARYRRREGGAVGGELAEGFFRTAAQGLEHRVQVLAVRVAEIVARVAAFLDPAAGRLEVVLAQVRRPALELRQVEGGGDRLARQAVGIELAAGVLEELAGAAHVALAAVQLARRPEGAGAHLLPLQPADPFEEGLEDLQAARVVTRLAAAYEEGDEGGGVEEEAARRVEGEELEHPAGVVEGLVAVAGEVVGGRAREEHPGQGVVAQAVAGLLETAVEGVEGVLPLPVFGQEIAEAAVIVAAAGRAAGERRFAIPVQGSKAPEAVAAAEVGVGEDPLAPVPQAEVGIVEGVFDRPVRQGEGSRIAEQGGVLTAVEEGLAKFRVLEPALPEGLARVLDGLGDPPFEGGRLHFFTLVLVDCVAG